ncbi:MAG: hypothetical protein ISR52_08525 [Rhodospirillales bacterium]|nr:hypothetical protein [Rhodospirillales bacterium]
MTDLCDRLELNWTFIKGSDCSPTYLGTNISHLRAYRHDQAKPPFLILEDDCEVTEYYSNPLEIPTDADIVYLGVSSCGIAPALGGRALEGAVIVTDFSEQLCRVHNMTSAHAVLYVTEKAQQLAIEQSLLCTIDRFWPFDVGLAEIQSQLNAYAYKKPMLYQANALQGKDKQFMEKMTKIDLGKIPVRETMKTAVDNNVHFFKLTETEKGRWQWVLMGKPKES